jgi:hypothetical protein
MTDQLCIPLFDSGPLTSYDGLNKALGQLPPCILNKSGRFLYSDISTLEVSNLEERRFYFLSHHPGGDPANYPDTLREEISKWQYGNNNAYDESDWSPNSKLQNGVKALSEAIGVSYTKLCASNLFFVRCKSSYNLQMTSDDLQAHWKVHEQILEIVKPHFIIASGIETYKAIKELMPHFDKTKKLHSGHKRWPYWYVAESRFQINKIKLIGLPNLSLYPIYCYPDVLTQIRNECS